MPERIRKILDSNLIEKFRETVNTRFKRYYVFKIQNDVVLYEQ